MATSTTQKPAPNVDQELVERLRLAVMRLARRLRQQAEPGVTPSMLSALSTLDNRGPMALGELADIERIQPPTLTRIIARLEEDELVERRVSEDDRRVAVVALTPAGRRFLRQTRGRKDAYLARKLAELQRDDLERLRGAIASLERLLEDGS